MKKYFTILIAFAMLLCLAACSGKSGNTSSGDDNKATATTKPASTQNNDANSGTVNPVQEVFRAGYSSATGAYATIKIDASLKMESDAWLGLCPTGTYYYDEREADDVDVIFWNAEFREDGDPYVFACDFSEVEDGTYALVVATSDSEDVGYIAIQVQMTKNGDFIAFDYSDAKLNDAPNK